jgi:phosphatidate cytidylyltransferase
MAPPRLAFSALSATLPAAAWLEAAGWVGERFFGAWFLALVAVVLLRTVGARRQEAFPDILPATASALLVLVYPGLLLSYIVRLAGLPNATRVLLFFFTLVLLNDIAAYLAGRALGRYTRVNLPVSPNKSGAGFAGGFLVSVAASLVFNRYYPDLLGGVGRALLIGGLLGALTILGDLAESGLKRSAGVKDSGTLIPGRGGILDSVDSWLLSAVALYYLLLR